MRTQYLARFLGALALCCSTFQAIAGEDRPLQLERPSIVFNVRNATERMEMTVNTSRILTLDQKILQAQADNQDILELTALSPNQILASAKATGVTKVNLWGEDEKIHAIDVVVFADTRELQLVLQTAFPNAALKVIPVANAVMISGYVDKAELVERIIRVAEEYYPKVINNMTVGGVQKVLLRIKVMEVSRTKLRQLGFDWAKITGSNVISSGPTGLITDYDPSQLISMGGLPLAGVATGKVAWRSASSSSFAFNVVNGASGFFGVLDAMRQDNLMKIMSEPNLVAINGQDASFNSGGEIPVPEPQSLGTISIAWKRYGTHLRFVPIVLGNGNVRLEVHSEISELDETRSFSISGTQVPGIKSRDVHTAVEMTAGQTLALAGLVQTRIEAENAGLPWISELPYLGAAFRSVKENRNEVELLILVTPELVEAMDACEVPPGGPGTDTKSPTDWELYLKGHLEVPNCCPTHGEGCNGDCRPRDGDEIPPEGMPAESIPTPAPADAAGRPPINQMAAGRRTGGSYNRYASSKPNSSSSSAPAQSRNGPPGFIGPVGYDVVK